MSALTVVSRLMNALILVKTVLTDDILNTQIAANGPTIKNVINQAMQEGRQYEDRSTNIPDRNSVNHPSHYNQIPGIECIDVVENFNFNIGNAVKYLWRAGLKTSDPTEDLKKAIWYAQREIDRIHGRTGP